MEKNVRRLEEILEFNKSFVENKEYEKYKATKKPEKKLVILSCMDTRLTELLPKAMNIKNGDAKIIKNAGATIMHPFGSIVRSILVAIYEFNAEDVLVVGHHGCGMSNLNSKDMISKMEDRGISEEHNLNYQTLWNRCGKMASWIWMCRRICKRKCNIIKKSSLNA